MKRFLAILIFSIGLVWAEEEQTQFCVPPATLSLTQHFGRGVGHTSYTSGELFIIQHQYPHFIPYVDGRFHRLAHGHFASNIGTGLRYLIADDQLALGGNLYYDYRHSKHLDTHQVAGGFELLSPYLDFRVNGYVPVAGTKKSKALQFDAFTGNQINVRRTTAYAFPSIHAEVGTSSPMIPKLYTDFYLSGGPYYLFGQTVSGNKYASTWGGKLRLGAHVTRFVSLEFELNHDSIFDTTYQGVISVHLPLWKLSACRKGASGYGKRTFYRRVLRPPVRNEIIPVKTQSKVFPLRDAQGNIIPIFFVNNLTECPGLGTFENPFCSFASVPSQSAIIYGFQGNEYTSTVNLNYRGQTLQGSGTPFTFREVQIPALTSGSPVFNPTAGVAINVTGNDVVVNGVTIANTAGGANAIQINNANSVVVENSVIRQSSGSGVFVENLSQNITIANNLIQNVADTGIGSTPLDVGSMIVVKNTITHSGQEGMNLALGAATGFIAYNTVSADNPVIPAVFIQASTGYSTVSYNTVSGTANHGILVRNGSHIVSHNRIDIVGGGINFTNVAGVVNPIQAHILNNFVRSTGIGVLVDNGVPGDLFAEIRDNYVEPVASPGIRVSVQNAGTFCTSISGNVVPTIELAGTAGPILVKQPFSVFETSNQVPVPASISGTVIFNSNCSAP